MFELFASFAWYALSLNETRGAEVNKVQIISKETFISINIIALQIHSVTSISFQ